MDSGIAVTVGDVQASIRGKRNVGGPVERRSRPLNGV